MSVNSTCIGRRGLAETGVRLWLLGVAILATLLMSATPAPAQTADRLFTVTDIAVDVTADSAVAAQQRAIATAERRAFRQLLEKLAPADAERLNEAVDASELPALVRDFSVEDERTGRTSYRAIMTVRFRPAAVTARLAREGVQLGQVEDETLVVLPVFDGPQGPVLWDDPNPWRRAWSTTQVPQGLASLVVPLGDLGDIRSVSVEQAVVGNAGALEAIATKNGANGVLVASATPGQATAATPGAAQALAPLTINLRRYRGTNLIGTTEITVAPAPTDTVESLFAKAVPEVAGAVDRTLEQAAVVGGGQASGGGAGQLDVIMSFDSIGDWADAQRRLRRVAAVGSIQIRALRRRSVQFDLRFAGDQALLDQQLAQNGLQLTPIATTVAAGQTPGQGSATYLLEFREIALDDGATRVRPLGQAGGPLSLTAPPQPLAPAAPVVTDPSAAGTAATDPAAPGTQPTPVQPTQAQPSTLPDPVSQPANPLIAPQRN